jgi:amidase
MEDFRYTSVRDHALPLVRAAVEGMLAAQTLDAIVYPTASRRPGLIADPGVGAAATPGALLGAMGLGGTNIANLTGFPDLIVPAGFTGDRLPVAISFVGPAFSEPRLLALGYSFEQLTRARRLPRHTPALSGEVISTP